MFKPAEIEFWEYEYLKQIYYLLNIDFEKMMDGFKTKDPIKDDWQKYMVGKELSDFATGSERIFYWLFNQFGKPNSSPVGSDLFFETYNAYVHIDIKTVTVDNINDCKSYINIGKNQSSYSGKIIYQRSGKNNVKGQVKEEYYDAHLPPVYHKHEQEKVTGKLCLTYFIVILHNPKTSEIHALFITCLPNGALKEIYEPEKRGFNVELDVPIYEPTTLIPGKNDGEARFNFSAVPVFKCLDGEPKRTKVLIYNPADNEMDVKLKEIRKFLDRETKYSDGV